MTFLLFFVGVLLVGTTGRLIAQAIVLPRLHLKEHLKAIQEYGFEPASLAEQEEPGGRLSGALGRLAERVGRFTLTHVPRLPALSPADLSAAGLYDTTPEKVHGYRVLAATGLPIVIILYVELIGAKFSLLLMLLTLSTVGAGWVLPGFVIRRRGAARLEQMDVQLPEVIDLLIATVEAGMGFSASIALIASRFRGALGDELRLAMKQQSLGSTTEQALEDMVERCSSPSIRAFVRTVNRGETLGVSIGPILRELAVDMRRRRRQAAREKMQKAPVKMLFPLMFLIFPALMIVLLYPAVYTVMNNLSGI
jgi:tight adherence protein C